MIDEQIERLRGLHNEHYRLYLENFFPHLTVEEIDRFVQNENKRFGQPVYDETKLSLEFCKKCQEYSWLNYLDYKEKVEQTHDHTKHRKSLLSDLHLTDWMYWTKKVEEYDSL